MLQLVVADRRLVWVLFVVHLQLHQSDMREVDKVWGATSPNSNAVWMAIQLFTYELFCVLVITIARIQRAVCTNNSKTSIFIPII